MTIVTQLIHDAGKYLLISVYPLPTHPTHNFTHNNGGNLETLPGWPKKLQHNRPARSAGQLQGFVRALAWFFFVRQKINCLGFSLYFFAYWLQHIGPFCRGSVLIVLEYSTVRRHIITPWHGNALRIIGPLWGESTCYWWQRACYAKFCCYLWC